LIGIIVKEDVKDGELKDLENDEDLLTDKIFEENIF
jgi:hypothetical protein